MNNAVLGANYEKCEKTLRYKTRNKLTKKKLLNVRSKLSFNKIFFQKAVSHRNE